MATKKISAAARKAMSAGMRRYWAKRKRATAVPTPEVVVRASAGTVASLRSTLGKTQHALRTLQTRTDSEINTLRQLRAADEERLQRTQTELTRLVSAPRAYSPAANRVIPLTAFGNHDLLSLLHSMEITHALGIFGLSDEDARPGTTTIRGFHPLYQDVVQEAVSRGLLLRAAGTTTLAVAG